MLRGVESYNHPATNEEGILLAHLDPAWYGRIVCTQTKIYKGQTDSEMMDALGNDSSQGFPVAKCTATVKPGFDNQKLELYNCKSVSFPSHII